jgi:glycosyltransferase involved in cell wall biosynthesis
MSDPLNILVDARCLVDSNGGGVRRVAENILAEVVNRMPETEFAFVTTGKTRFSLPEPFALSSRITHVHINIPNKIWSLLAMFGTAALDREATRRTKVTYDAAILPNIGFTGFLTIPYALVLHDLSFIIDPHWYSLKMRVWHYAVNAKDQIRRAARLFAVSETTKRDTARLLNIPDDRIEIVRPGVSLNRITSVRPSGFGRLNTYVLAFGESNPRKNIATAVAAVERLRQEDAFRELQLVIVGSTRDGLLPTNADWMFRLNNVTDEQLAGLYEGAAALLYPSWYEGFGLPLHEAARFGTPCLASNHGALPETAPPGTILLPPTKPQLWASALRDVLHHPARFRTARDPHQDHAETLPILHWLQCVQSQKNSAQ